MEDEASAFLSWKYICSGVHVHLLAQKFQFCLNWGKSLRGYTWGLTVAKLGHVEETHIFWQLLCFVVWDIYLMNEIAKWFWHLMSDKLFSAGLFFFSLSCLKNWVFGVVEEGAVGGEGVILPFQFSAVTCSWIHNCRVGLYNARLVWFAVSMGWIRCLLFPSSPLPGSPWGVPRDFSVPFVAHALVLCSWSPLPSHRRPFCSRGSRADCSSQESLCHYLLPSLLSPQLLPWVSCSCSSFFCPTFFSFPMGFCPSLLSQPQSSSFYEAVPSDRVQTLHLLKKSALFPLYIRSFQWL